METININELEVLPNEIWKLHPIGVAVSTLGRLFVPKSKNHKAHYTYGTVSGKYMILHRNNKNFKVHRLVADCFIPNFENKPFIDHRNMNGFDNRVENLRWATMSENNGGFKDQNWLQKVINAHLNQTKKVLQFDKDLNYIRCYDSLSEVHKSGYDKRNVSNACLGRVKTAYNYIWKYA